MLCLELSVLALYLYLLLLVLCSGDCKRTNRSLSKGNAIALVTAALPFAYYNMQ